MILSNLVVKWLEVIIEVGLWVFLISCFVAGFSAGSGFFGSLVSGILSLIVGGVLSAVFFGVFILLKQIERHLSELLQITKEKPSEIDPTA
ncbi:hypothetical protein ACFL3I_03770 [Pseudomonadota bacterium]